MFSKNDIKQINDRGLTVEKVENQIKNFVNGFPYIELAAPATPGNGLNQYTEDEINELADYFNSHYQNYEVLKFVPASGAASRMFKHLFEFYNSYKKTEENIREYEDDKGFNSVYNFFTNIQKFAFYEKLKELLDNDGYDLDELVANKDFTKVLEYFITETGMDYANLPKGLLLFHDYQDEPRTSVEEHMVEGAVYSTDKNGISRVHLTVSPEHQIKFENKVESKRDKYQGMFKTTYDISFSQQKPETDIIAVSPDNKPFRTSDGNLLFRPGGHGALIENLNDLKGEIIFVKNIDNIVPDRLRDTTYLYKKAFGGLLLKLQEQVFNNLDILDEGNPTEDEIKEIESFAKNELNIFIPDAYEGYDKMEKIDFLFNKLNRPMRICGMVKNEGEPGGGPFWVKGNDGSKSLQVVESSQMDLKNDGQKEIVTKATHFNPVDLVCAVRDFKGNNFNLKEYVDPQTGFISVKSLGDKSLKAQELPGLWNGAMADWITVFAEAPIITFNPVKTINDLLRPQHQPD